MKKIIGFSIVMLALSGCATQAMKAWDMSSLVKTLGAENPSFILKYSDFSIHTGLYDNDKVRNLYSKRICESYNEDAQLKALKENGVITSYPKCHHNSKNNDLKIEVGTTKTRCLLKCIDRYIRYEDGRGIELAYNEGKKMAYLEAIEYSAGHIKNMVIAANLDAHGDDPAWRNNLERVCKEVKTLKSVCR
jgi:hypothetical protein